MYELFCALSWIIHNWAQECRSISWHGFGLHSYKKLLLVTYIDHPLYQEHLHIHAVHIRHQNGEKCNIFNQWHGCWCKMFKIILAIWDVHTPQTLEFAQNYSVLLMKMPGGWVTTGENIIDSYKLRAVEDWGEKNRLVFFFRYYSVLCQRV